MSPSDVPNPDPGRSRVLRVRAADRVPDALAPRGQVEHAPRGPCDCQPRHPAGGRLRAMALHQAAVRRRADGRGSGGGPARAFFAPSSCAGFGTGQAPGAAAERQRADADRARHLGRCRACLAPGAAIPTARGFLPRACAVRRDRPGADAWTGQAPKPRMTRLANQDLRGRRQCTCTA